MPNTQSNVIQGGSLILGSMFIIGLIDNFIRFVAQESAVWQFYFLRALLAVAIIVAFCLWKKQPLLPQRFWAVSIRSLLLAAAILNILLLPCIHANRRSWRNFV